MDININPKQNKPVGTDSIPEKTKKEEIVESSNEGLTNGIEAQDSIGRASFNILSEKENKLIKKDELLDISYQFADAVEEIAGDKFSDSVVESVIDEYSDPKAKKCATKAIRIGLFGTKEEANPKLIPSLKMFNRLYEHHPEFTEKLVSKEFPFIKEGVALSKAYEFFNGSEDGRFIELNDEQTDFAIELSKNSQEGILTDRPRDLNENLSEISPKYYDIISVFSKSNTISKPLHDLVEDIRTEHPDDLDKLLTVVKAYPKTVPNISDSFSEIMYNLDNLTDACEYEVSLDSITKLKLKYPDLYEKIMKNLKNFRQNEENKSKDIGIVELSTKKADDQHIRLENNSPLFDKQNAPDKSIPDIIKFDKETGEIVAYIDKYGNTHNLKTGTVAQTEVIKDYYTPSHSKIRHKLINDDVTKEIIKSYSPVSGEYNIYDIDPNGKIYKVGLAETKNGGRHIEKHLTSLNGTTTDYVYADDIDGNKFLYYKVTDSDGEILYENSRSFKVLGKNHFISRCNDNKFDIKFTDDKITVTKLDKENHKTDKKVIYEIKDFSDESYEEIEKIGDDIIEKEAKQKNIPVKEYNDYLDNNPQELYRILNTSIRKYAGGERVVDRSFVPLLKQLSGDEWFSLDKTNTVLICGGYNENENACSFGNAVLLNKTFADNIGVLEHEIGHQKFHAFDYEKDEEFIKLYEKEKKLFTETFPDADIEQVKYFFSERKGDKQRGRNELCAEVNLITNTFQSWDKIKDRTIMIQTYMPETLAYVAKKNREMLSSD